MNIKPIAILLLFCMASPMWAGAQTGQLTSITVEYGDLSELAGKRRVFVQAENLSSRDRIVKELLKASRPELEVVGRLADADFILTFGAGITQTGPGAVENFVAGGGGEAASVSGGMVVLRLVGGEAGEGARTRILWHADKRQTLIRTDQLFRATYSGSPRSNLIGLAVGGLLSAVPRLSVIPLGRSPEVKATRDFIKALRKVYERHSDYARTSPPLPTDVRPAAADPALAGESRRRLWSESPAPVQLSAEALHASRPLYMPVERPTLFTQRGGGRGRRSQRKTRPRSEKLKKGSRRTRALTARIAAAS